MHERLIRSAVSVLITAFLVVCSNIPVSQASERETPVNGFPEASLTIFPVTFTITGPVKEHSGFADALKRKFRDDAQDITDIFGSLLREQGYEKFQTTDTEFRFPMEPVARKERAAAFSKFVSELELKTDYALCTELTLHLEESFQEVYAVIVDAQGAIVWEDSQGSGDAAFDKDPPGTELKCLELICKRLTPAMGLDDLPNEQLAPGENQALQKRRAEQPPSQSEFTAIEKRLQAMKKAGTTARVVIYPTRVGGDRVDRSSATSLSDLLNQEKLCQATEAETGPVLEGNGWPNEAAVLWLFARAAQEYAQQQSFDSDYVLFADYWFAPDDRVWAVHFVICDRAGDWVIVDMQNNHHEDFQRIDPKTLADCDRIVLERIKKHLR